MSEHTKGKLELKRSKSDDKKFYVVDDKGFLVAVFPFSTTEEWREPTPTDIGLARANAVHYVDCHNTCEIFGDEDPEAMVREMRKALVALVTAMDKWPEDFHAFDVTDFATSGFNDAEAEVRALIARLPKGE